MQFSYVIEDVHPLRSLRLKNFLFLVRKITQPLRVAKGVIEGKCGRRPFCKKMPEAGLQ